MRLNKKRKRSGWTSAFMITAGFLALFIWLDVITRPVIKGVIEYHAKVFATRLLNEAMELQLEESEVGYGSLVAITRGENGDVMSIEADMAQINRLKTQLNLAVVDRLENEKNREIQLPVGTIVGNQFTSGRGPEITIKIIPTGYVQSEIQNRLSSAGINQTLHQIMLKVSVQVIAVMPGYNVRTETSTNFPIAETVIVGRIPQGYASIETGAATFAPIQS
ncbi:MAG: sporulation protein YunB [Oscillospiraceae bacterium]|nr:sporulation protein YunB [Oscillospiraceae bacterium]